MNSKIENLFVGAYWSARKETRKECALRIVKFLQSIGDDPLFQHWYFKARSRRAATTPLELSIQSVEGKLRANNRESDGSVLEDLGLSFSIWNGSDDFPASFAVTCGAFSEHLMNCAVLELPPQSPPIDTAACETFRRLLEKTVAAWDPDNVVLTSHELINRAGGGMPWQVGGWLIYRRGGNIRSAAVEL